MSNPCPKPRAVLAKDQAIDIFRLSISNDTQKIKPTAISVAKKYRVSEKTVRDIWTGRTWQEETLVFDLTRSPREAKKTGRPLGRKDSGPRKMKATIGNIRKNPQITKSASVKVLHSEYKEFTRDGEVGAFQIDEQEDIKKGLKFDPTISTVHRPDGWLREGRATSIELDQSPVPTTELDEMQRHLIDPLQRNLGCRQVLNNVTMECHPISFRIPQAQIFPNPLENQNQTCYHLQTVLNPRLQFSGPRQLSRSMKSTMPSTMPSSLGAGAQQEAVYSSAFTGLARPSPPSTADLIAMLLSLPPAAAASLLLAAASAGAPALAAAIAASALAAASLLPAPAAHFAPVTVPGYISSLAASTAAAAAAAAIAVLPPRPSVSSLAAAPPAEQPSPGLGWQPLR